MWRRGRGREKEGKEGEGSRTALSSELCVYAIGKRESRPNSKVRVYYVSCVRVRTAGFTIHSLSPKEQWRPESLICLGWGATATDGGSLMDIGLRRSGRIIYEYDSNYNSFGPIKLQLVEAVEPQHLLRLLCCAVTATVLCMGVVRVGGCCVVLLYHVCLSVVCINDVGATPFGWTRHDTNYKQVISEPLTKPPYKQYLNIRSSNYILEKGYMSHIQVTRSLPLLFVPAMRGMTPLPRCSYSYPYEYILTGSLPTYQIRSVQLNNAGGLLSTFGLFNQLSSIGRMYQRSIIL